MSDRNSCSRRGVVVKRGVIQCGCAACVWFTRLNQLAKYPPLAEFWATTAGVAMNGPRINAQTAEAFKLGSPERNSELWIRCANRVMVINLYEFI